MSSESDHHHPTCKIDDGDVRALIDSALSRAPRTLEDIYFVPWVGKNFGNSEEFGQTRVLILGESHYEWCRACWVKKNTRPRDLTCRVVAEQAVRDNSANLQHWTKIENALLGKTASSVQRKTVWHSLAYYNFVQEIVGFESRVRPTHAMWENARAALLTLMECLEPDVVVTLGVELWRELPQAKGPETMLEANGKSLERCWYRFGSGRKIIVCRAPHPAAGLGATWHEVLMAAVKTP